MICELLEGPYGERGTEAMGEIRRFLYRLVVTYQEADMFDHEAMSGMALTSRIPTCWMCTAPRAGISPSASAFTSAWGQDLARLELEIVYTTLFRRVQGGCEGVRAASPPGDVVTLGGARDHQSDPSPDSRYEPGHGERGPPAGDDAVVLMRETGLQGVNTVAKVTCRSSRPVVP
ncbi:hypothetical protein [Nonomuraea sp. KM88]|uniref:hypothetical protein n=1 Tax=Nonomuraea sp. KM88 TaxID=3457427 RepID=UPI003FCD308B